MRMKEWNKKEERKWVQNEKHYATSLATWSEPPTCELSQIGHWLQKSMAVVLVVVLAQKSARKTEFGWMSVHWIVVASVHHTHTHTLIHTNTLSQVKGKLVSLIGVWLTDGRNMEQYCLEIESDQTASRRTSEQHSTAQHHTHSAAIWAHFYMHTFFQFFFILPYFGFLSFFRLETRAHLWKEKENKKIWMKMKAKMCFRCSGSFVEWKLASLFHIFSTLQSAVTLPRIVELNYAWKVKFQVVQQC